MKKVALVYDRVNKWGGAERVLLTLHELFPKAPLYTAVYNPKTAPWAKVFNIKTSFLQKLPLAAKHHELFPWLTPLAFESFDFDEFDCVISVTSAEAKGIITKPGTQHICYCLTPTRYLWSQTHFYQRNSQFGIFNLISRPIAGRLFSKLRRWDYITAQRVDQFIAISRTVQERIRKYYHRESAVVYPPVEVKRIINGPKYKIPDTKYYLLVSRLVPYKRVDVACKAFNQLGWRLKVVGTGSELSKLKKAAGSNIEFLGQLTDDKLFSYYHGCRAVVFTAEEDFGLVPIEAQAAGKPVVAFGRGGARETVIDGKTGVLYNQQSADSLIKAIHRLDNIKIDPKDCQENSLNFSKKKFFHQLLKQLCHSEPDPTIGGRK